MTPDEFQALSIALLRSAIGWQTAIAKRLGFKDASRIRKWLRGAEDIPPWVDARFAEWTGAAALAPWPRDEWMIGDALGGDGNRREYIAHLQAPRFVARIVQCDDDVTPLADELPADILSGTVYCSEDYVLAEITWIDEVAPGEIVKWLDAAADAIDGVD
jgi:hypothetical protein